MTTIPAVESVCTDAMSYDNVIAICLDKDGNVTVHTSITYPPDILFAIETAKNQLFDMGVSYDA